MVALQLLGASLAFFVMILLCARLWKHYSNAVNAMLDWIRRLFAKK